MNLLRTIQICVTTFIFIWCGFLTIVLSFKLYKFKQSRNINIPTAASTIINYTGWCFGYFLTAICYIYQFNGAAHTAVFSIFTILYSISYASSYIFVVLIAYSSFKESDYAMRRCTITIHVLIVIILWISCSSATFFLYVIPNYLGGMLTFLNVTVYTFGLCSIMISVNIKLIQMIILCEENPKQSSFLVAITKLSVLTTVFTTTSIIYVFIAVIHHLIFNTLTMAIIEWIFYGFTVFTGTLCMYLTYAFNKLEYDIICKQFNNGFSKCCVWTIHKLISSKTVQHNIAEKRATVTLSVAQIQLPNTRTSVNSTTTPASYLSSPTRQLSPKLEQIKEEEFDSKQMETIAPLSINKLSLFHRGSAGKSSNSNEEFTAELIAHDSMTLTTPDELINIQSFDPVNVANQTLTLQTGNAKSHPLFASDISHSKKKNIPKLKFLSLSSKNGNDQKQVNQIETELEKTISNGDCNDENEGELVIICEENV